jgi:hypothetical protein
MKNTDRKKIHHFVHDAYLAAWRDVDSRIYVLNRLSGKTYEPTGRNSVGAIGRFNDFSFDPTVLALLKFTFGERANDGGPNNAYRVMLALMEFMKDFAYANKETNFLEDFFAQIEGGVTEALTAVRSGPLTGVLEHEAFDNLVIFYFLQMMRTAKARTLMLQALGKVYCNNVPLSQEQTVDYVKVQLLVNSLAMAMDVIDRGCRLSFGSTRPPKMFINSDSPVICLNLGHLERIEDHCGCLPLSPSLLMRIDEIGCRGRAQRSLEVNDIEVDALNRRMVDNVERSLFFSTKAQRDEFASLIAKISSSNAAAS